VTEAGDALASNLVLLVSEAQAALDLCNAAMPPSKRLIAPAHITLVVKAMSPGDFGIPSATVKDWKLADPNAVRLVERHATHF
jgi:hypothetical protein